MAAQMGFCPHGRIAGAHGTPKCPHRSNYRRTDGKIAARNEFCPHEEGNCPHRSISRVREAILARTKESWLARSYTLSARMEFSPHGHQNGRTERFSAAQTGQWSARGEFSSPEPVSRNPMLTFGDIRCFIPVMSEARKELLVDLLKATSRSFYLTLRVLPARVRPQIGLAYLLARTTDTIADTELVPPAQRLDALQKLRERILGQNSAPLNFGELAQKQNLSAEKLLLEKVEDSLSALQKFSAEDQKLIRDVLTTITSGQELDLKRFGNVAKTGSSATGQQIIALETAAELDDYTYRVAGCVGEFWTKICRAHLFPNAKLDEKQFLNDGIRFGKGLQLVNILRDLPTDLKNGRCYLPTQRLDEAKLFPETLLSPANEQKFLPLFHNYLDKAESHLRAGWRYTNTLPFAQFRVRLACAWPILLGMKTIEKLRVANVIELRQRVKVSRREVRGILLRSLASCPLPSAWRKQFPASRKAVASAAELA
jgi:farnesyl-diphosphate farnesyltransferase